MIKKGKTNQKESRSNHITVTETLVGQAEDAFRIFITGVDQANTRVKGVLLHDVDAKDIYNGLKTMLLRILFILYAEDKGLLPIHNPLYNQTYSIGGLWVQLHEDHRTISNSLEKRYGAWKRLCVLFQLMYHGCEYSELSMPLRQGDLFDPETYNFLVGHSNNNREAIKVSNIPEIDDLCIYKILHKLRILNGQFLSYRNLEVEQIGSVYEYLMSLQIERAKGPSVVLTRDKIVVDLFQLRNSKKPHEFLMGILDKDFNYIKKHFAMIFTWKPTTNQLEDVKKLQKILFSQTMEHVISIGCHYLKGAPNRRWSGSHYTPRTLSGEIVRKTIDPVLGKKPTPEKILSIKVCDPAMGTAAFLAQACRYLGDKLVEAWLRTGTYTEKKDNEELTLIARRIIAKNCLYGVDKNQRAVHLARLSMWIVTSAKDHPFTFFDHNLKYGDAVVGCTKNQISTFDLDEVEKQRFFMPSTISVQQGVDQKPLLVSKKNTLTTSKISVRKEKVIGDLLIACLHQGGSKKERIQRISRIRNELDHWYKGSVQDLSDEANFLLCSLYKGEFGFVPFHWELEFPEIFEKEEPGFDVIVGNPPFMGKNTLSKSSGPTYGPLLGRLFPHVHGNSDLYVYFFLKVSTHLLARNGCAGLISSNSINQGENRRSGLHHMIVKQGMELYDVTQEMVWPVSGANVVISITHFMNGNCTTQKYIDRQPVSQINSEFEDLEEHKEPIILKQNSNLSFRGTIILGMGFTISPEQRNELLVRDERYEKYIEPYIGGDELNHSPELTHHRYVINLDDLDLEEAHKLPDLLKIVQNEVKPSRDKIKGESDIQRRRKKFWWKYGGTAHHMNRAISNMDRCLACSSVTKQLVFGFQSTKKVFANSLAIFALDRFSHFAILQSSVHYHWAMKMGSRMGKALRYTPSTIFETFPFPHVSENIEIELEERGKTLYHARLDYMTAHQIGMTETWNRIREPSNKHFKDKDVNELRSKYYEMDLAVLKAYGWEDVEPKDSKKVIERLRKCNMERALEEIMEEYEHVQNLIDKCTFHLSDSNKEREQPYIRSNNRVYQKVQQAEKKRKSIQKKAEHIHSVIMSLRNQQLDFDIKQKKTIHKQLEELQKSALEIQTLIVQ